LSLTYIPTLLFFFFHDTATTEIYTLSLHDALPISLPSFCNNLNCCWIEQDNKISSSLKPILSSLDISSFSNKGNFFVSPKASIRSEEHTSELQSRENLVCRLLLEKKNKNVKILMMK